MSVSLVSRNVARKLLLVQLLVVIASGLLFSLKDPFWGVSAISGGLAVFLPNVLFMIFAWRHQAHTPAKGRVAWTFAFGEAFKVLAMLVLLVVALAVLKAVFLPLIVTWVLVLVQLESIAITVVWSGVVAFIGYKVADMTVGLRVPEEQEREGLDVNSHGENAYNA